MAVFPLFLYNLPIPQRPPLAIEIDPNLDDG